MCPCCACSLFIPKSYKALCILSGLPHPTPYNLCIMYVGLQHPTAISSLAFVLKNYVKLWLYYMEHGTIRVHRTKRRRFAPHFPKRDIFVSPKLLGGQRDVELESGTYGHLRLVGLWYESTWRDVQSSYGG